jgi:hypothetical protein
MSVASRVLPSFLGVQAGSLARSGMPGGSNSDDQLDRVAYRALLMFVMAVAIWSLFLVLWVVSPGMTVHRSDQARGLLTEATPVETVDAFRAIAGFERCAVGNGVREAFGGQWKDGGLSGVSYVTYTHWRDECGGMSLVFPAYQAGEQARAKMRDLIVRLRVVGEQLGEASVAGTATDAMFERAARDFHVAAKDAGLRYRLISWVRR